MSFRNDIAEKEQLQIHTVIHPTKGERDSNGSMRIPTPYDMKGGSEWVNFGQQQITVDRSTGPAKVMKMKNKPRSVGGIGTVEMGFDRKKFRYYFQEGAQKMFFDDYRALNNSGRETYIEAEKVAEKPKKEPQNTISEDDLRLLYNDKEF